MRGPYPLNIRDPALFRDALKNVPMDRLPYLRDELLTDTSPWFDPRKGHFVRAIYFRRRWGRIARWSMISALSIAWMYSRRYLDSQ